ncbi:MAG: hypothetical protein OSB14_10680 [Planctomycetota bacterium]|nr:hypothetical protein [Planctomycetota bacterium]
MKSLCSAFIPLSLIGVLSCAATERAPGVSEEKIESDVLAAASSYMDWGGPVDFQLRFGPTLCMIPPLEPRFSESDLSGPHAEKLYFIHASDASSYAGVDYASEGEGGFLMPDSNFDLESRAPSLPEFECDWSQVLVKEAFAPSLYSGEEAELSHPFEGGEPFKSLVQPAERDGEQWVPGEFVGLYLMLRTSRETPGTDEGWVYATVEADGAVTAYGQIPSCVGCHRRAGSDRMFGLPGVDHEPSVSD